MAPRCHYCTQNPTVPRSACLAQVGFPLQTLLVRWYAGLQPSSSCR